MKYAGGEGAPKFLLVAANAALALSDKPAAVRALQLILKDHARSGAAEEAKAKLKALGVN